MSNILGQVIHTVDLDFIGSSINSLVGRGSNCNVVSLNAVKIENFLQSNSDRCTTAPDCNDECRVEAAIQNFHTEQHAIGQ